MSDLSHSNAPVDGLGEIKTFVAESQGADDLTVASKALIIS